MADSAAPAHALGPYRDLARLLARPARDGPLTPDEARRLLHVPLPAHAAELHTGRSWKRDGVEGVELSWHVGYGPRSEAWLLRPAGHAGPLPGVLALHDHGGYKLHGKEKIADGPDALPPHMQLFRDELYGGTAMADELARAGYAVLVHDCFLWGSRRFPLETIPPDERAFAAAKLATHDWRPTWPDEVNLYNLAAIEHEHVVEKYCRLLGTTIAALVSHEDRIAVDVLLAQRGVAGETAACVGLSGGGARAVLLQAACGKVHGTVVAGMMSSYAGMLEADVSKHTWLLYPAGLPALGDWPDLAAARRPAPMLVQYNQNDQLFALPGQQAAHDRLLQHHAHAPGAYEGRFYPGPHKFDRTMQRDAHAWLAAQLEKTQ